LAGLLGSALVEVFLRGDGPDNPNAQRRKPAVRNGARIGPGRRTRSDGGLSKVASELNSEEVEDEEHVLDVDPDQEVMTVSYDIASYGADYPVDGLVKRLDQGDVVVPSFDPQYNQSDEVQGFQRRFVWTRPQMDKFIESLLLGLPVPGIFLVRDKSNKLLVLDGQQRLRTLQAFYRGIHGGREYKLKHVQSPFRNQSYEDLDDEDRRRLDDSIIHATVLRQDFPSDSQDAVYSIFERLNTGGSPLQPQEIRIALYNGSFLRVISWLNENEDWRELYGPISPRFKDHELILRVLALYEEASSYTRPVKGFLNRYLRENRDRTADECAELTELFARAAALIHNSIGPKAFRPVRPLNAAVLDSVMVGVMRRLALTGLEDKEAAASAYQTLIERREYLAVTTSSTAAEESVSTRLAMATDTFASI
jgi:hypothetical protein